MKNPLVSVIVTTKNEERNIKNCLESIQKQTYRNIESIVVDNNSADKTKQLARKYTKLVFDKGPERSAQRNFGAQKAKGEYVVFLDADMILTQNVILACIEKITNQQVGGVIIPESSFGEGFWAACKRLEKTFYVDNDSIEAARFFNKKKFLSTGGYDENLTGPEDWDLSQKVKRRYELARIQKYIFHNEGKLSLMTTLRKKYYYAKKFAPYAQKTVNKEYKDTQLSIVKRYSLFLFHPGKLFKKPILGLGLLFMKTAEFGAGALGYLEGK